MSNLPDDLGPRLRKSLNHGAPPELSSDVVTGAANRTPPKLSSPRRTVQIAGGATALVVAAVAVVALVVAPTLNRPPLFTAAASTASSESTTANGAAVPSAHGLFRLWANYVYKAGSSLSTDGGNGDVYQLTRSGSGDDRMKTLADAFGLTGQAVTTDNSDASSPQLTIGAVDGSTPALYLSWSGTGDWSYSDQDAVPPTVCSSAEGSTASPPNCDETDQSTGPDNAPVGDDARQKAQKLFAETGLDVATNDITLETDSDSTTATASLEVDGTKTALDWGVSWSSTGKISQAYGSSISVVDRGSFGTVSAKDAVSRLSDSRWSGEAGPKYSGGIHAFSMRNSAVGTVTNGAPVPDAISSPAPFTAPSGSSTGSPGEDPTATPVPDATGSPVLPTVPAPPTDPATPEPMPTAPPTIVITVNTAEPTLLLMWDSKGNGWLVPGYAMKVEAGIWDGVVSLVPGVIELPPVPSVEPDDVAPATDGSGN